MVLFSFKEGNLELFWLIIILKWEKNLSFILKQNKKKGDLCWFMIKDF